MADRYHYTMCGLDNVYLKGPGVQVKESKHGETVTIAHMDELHKLIAIHIATRNFNLTGKELRFLRVQLDLSQAKFATLIESTKQNIGRYERDDLEDGIPGAVQMASRMLFLTYIGHTETKIIVQQLAELDRLMEGDRLFCSNEDSWEEGDGCNHGAELPLR